MTIEIREVPGAAGETLRIFRNPQHAARHICDHILAAPECEGWALVCPNFPSLISLDSKMRFRAARQVLKLDDPAQALYEIYGQAIVEALTSASRLQWDATKKGTRVALGSSGLLVIITDRVVRSAFLPGFGDPEQVKNTSASEAPLRREASKSMRTRGRRRRRTPRRTAVPEHEYQKKRYKRWLELEEREELQKQCEDWSPEERLYHEVFRRVVIFVRDLPSSSSELAGGSSRRNDYILLHNVLPPLSKLKYANWCAMRRPPESNQHGS
jgi:hypothetical protein